MIFENEALNRVLSESQTTATLDRDRPGFAISRSNLFIQNMALSDSPINAARSAGVPDEEVDEFIEAMMANPNIHIAIAHEREQAALSDKILSIEGIGRTLTELIMVGRAKAPDPGMALSYEVGEAPASLFSYNPAVVLKSIDTLLRIKELEKKGVSFDTAESSGTQAAMREIGRLIHET